jgi:sugar/nucleoside kinase (ribokinase family)
MLTTTPDMLVLGHVAKDLNEHGYVLGGVATYASITAARLGLHTAVVTSHGPDVDTRDALRGVPLHIVPSATTTTFINTYHDQRRTQVISDVASPIKAEDVPPAWRDAPLVLMGCLAGELSSALLDSFPNAVTIAVIQGWLRRWDEQGNVYPGNWDGVDVLPRVSAAILSEDDIADTNAIEPWIERTPVLIYTRGAYGADVYVSGRLHHVEAYPTRSMDPTGAGDVFAAAWLARFGETADPIESARFASCVASFSVEQPGYHGIPTRDRVEARMARWR